MYIYCSCCLDRQSIKSHLRFSNRDRDSSFLATAGGEVTHHGQRPSVGVESLKAQRKPLAVNINIYGEYGMGLHLMPKRAHPPTADDCWKK